MAGQGHVRISIVRQPGAIRQVLLLLDDKASVDDGILTNTISMAAGLDAYKDTPEQSLQSQKTTPIEKEGERPPRRKVIRRVVKKPSPPSDSSKQ